MHAFDYFCLGYLDPGTGSMVLQVVVGAALGGAYFFRNSLRTVVGWFRFGGSGSAAEPTEPTDQV